MVDDDEFEDVEKWIERLSKADPLFEKSLRKARIAFAETEIAQARLSPETIARLRRGEGPPPTGQGDSNG